MSAEMVELWRSGMTQAAVARQLGVSREAVRQAVIRFDRDRYRARRKKMIVLAWRINEIQRMAKVAV